MDIEDVAVAAAPEAVRASRGVPPLLQFLMPAWLRGAIVRAQTRVCRRRTSVVFFTAVAAVLAVAVDNVSDALQKLLIYHPQRSQGEIILEKRQLQQAKQSFVQGFEVREVAYTVAAGGLWPRPPLGQRGILVLPRGRDGGGAAKGVTRLWVVFGGNAMVASDWLGFVHDQLLQAKGGDTSRLTSAFLLLDYPGYGVNEGSPSKGAAFRSAVAGIRAALDEMRASVGAPRALSYLGHSLGCAAVTQVAAALAMQPPPWLGETSPAGRIVLSAPFTSIVGMGCHFFGKLPGISLLISAIAMTSRHTWDNVRSLRALGRAAGAKGDSAPDIAIVHGTQDEIVPVQMGRDLYQLCRRHGFSRLAWVERPSAGHNNVLDEAFSEFGTLLFSDGWRAGRL